jgi:hypothetical protein
MGPSGDATAASLVAQLRTEPGRLPVAWCAFGPPCSSVYFPLFLHGEVPPAFRRDAPAGEGAPLWRRVVRLSERLLYDPERWVLARDSFARLQARFDLEAEEFVAEVAALGERGGDVSRQASLFMQHHLEQFETVFASLEAGRTAARPFGRPHAERAVSVTT